MKHAKRPTTLPTTTKPTSGWPCGPRTHNSLGGWFLVFCNDFDLSGTRARIGLCLALGNRRRLGGRTGTCGGRNSDGLCLDQGFMNSFGNNRGKLLVLQERINISAPEM